MAWTTPTICEVCVGMEVTAYEFERVLIRFTAQADQPRRPSLALRHA